MRAYRVESWLLLVTMSTLYYILIGETFLAGIKNGSLLELSWDGEQLHVDNFEPNVFGES